jgi:hypothetical protein
MQAGHKTVFGFAVDREVEHCEILLARLDLKTRRGIRDFLWLEGALLADEPPLIPGRTPAFIWPNVGAGNGSDVPL